MSEHGFRLPTLLATSVVRGSRQGESHGGVYLLDFAAQEVRQVVDWNTANIDWQGRGWDRGLRGIAFHGDETYIAASDELFVYDRQFNIRRSFRNPFLKHCHEIHACQGHLFLSSTGFDSILAFDLQRQRFAWGLQLVQDGEAFSGRAFDPHGLDGPLPGNRLHLNNIFVDGSGMWASGLRSHGLLRIVMDRSVQRVVELPAGVHNARPFGEGVLFNDTAANTVRYATRDGRAVNFAVPQYPQDELTHLELGDEQVARQGFGRGLCVIDQRFIAAGSSPSTVSLYDLDSGTTVMRVNLSPDIRNAIHGLEVWP
jgi:hypothetical protein